MGGGAHRLGRGQVRYGVVRAGAGGCSADWDEGSQARVVPGRTVTKVTARRACAGFTLGVWAMITGNAARHHIPLHSGSRATSNATKHTPAIASIVYSTFPVYLSGALQCPFLSSPLVFSAKQQQSSAGVSTGAFDLADLNAIPYGAAPLTEKIVELGLAVWLSGVVASSLARHSHWQLWFDQILAFCNTD